MSKMQANDHWSTNENEWARQHSIVFAIAINLRKSKIGGKIIR